MTATRRELRLEGGTVFRAVGGVIGLPASDGFGLYLGYDSRLETQLDAEFDAEFDESALTLDECKEVAHHMIERWTNYLEWLDAETQGTTEEEDRSGRTQPEE